jgi:acyl dehydratase
VRIFKDFNEVKAAVGTEVGVSDWVEVTQQRVEQFAQAIGDEQWIHVNVERATRELPGHSTIAHGLLTLALAPGIVRSVMGVKGIKNTQNYGAKSYSLLDPSARGLKAARWG